MSYNWHKMLPWDELKHWYAMGRKRWFDVPRPEGTYITISPTDRMSYKPNEITRKRNKKRILRVLGSSSFAPNWEYSYYKKGEDINLARVVYSIDPAHPGVKWWQVHVRGWIQKDGTIHLRGHWEPEPTENPDKHLKEVGFDHGYGMDQIKKYLARSSISFSEVKYERG